MHISVLSLLLLPAAQAYHQYPSRITKDEGLQYVKESDYYKDIDGTQKDLVLKNSLTKLIFQHTTVSYKRAWDAFGDVDQSLIGYPCSSNLTYIPDIYSDSCWVPDKQIQPDANGECGTYKKEGDCFNREHSWPKSWFGGFSAGKGAQSDLFLLFPSDGYVNGLRSSLPLGNVDKSQAIRYTSTNGALIGQCKNFDGQCFEPGDVHKGDLARTYFYISTAYDNQWSCCDNDGTNLASIKSWMEDDLRGWHALDPVDDIERARNERIYGNWQHNRNPFIDYPEWVDQISDF